jgi:hypothetical protein
MATSDTQAVARLPSVRALARQLGSTLSVGGASERYDGALAPVLFAGAAFSFGYAVQIANGAYSPDALFYVTIGCCATAAGVIAPAVGASRQVAPTVVACLLGACLAMQIALMLGALPGIYQRTFFWADVKVRLGLALAMFFAGLGAVSARLAKWMVAPLLLAIHFTLAVWTIGASPEPHIDGYVWHTTAFRALAAGHSPYDITIPNIYGSTAWYGPGIATPDRVLVGYPYPPLSLILGWLGSFFGDYRYANAAATTLAGAFMAYARPGRVASAAAALFLFSPRLLFVLEQGWTEPQVLLFVAASVFAACRAPRFLPYTLGLLVASKQYAVFLLPFVFLLQGRPTIRSYLVLVAKALAIAAAITLPLALWNVRAFYGAVVALQFKQPFRSDALSFLAYHSEGGLPRLPLATNFVALAVAMGVALLRARRTPAGFAAASALALTGFVVFAKQAFCNYYVLLVGLLCCAAAGAVLGPPSRSGANEGATGRVSVA